MMTLQNDSFFFFPFSVLRHPFIKLFHLSNLLQMPNDHRMADTEFLGNFSRSFKRISFVGPLNWSLSTSNGWSPHISPSRLSSPLRKFLNYKCATRLLAVPGPNAFWCKLSPLLYDPFWTQIRKLLVCFFLASFP